MKDAYKVEVLPKQIHDQIFSEIIGITVCNNETKSIFTTTVLVIFGILLATVVLHLSLLSIKKGEKTTIRLPFGKDNPHLHNTQSAEKQ